MSRVPGSRGVCVALWGVVAACGADAGPSYQDAGSSATAYVCGPDAPCAEGRCIDGRCVPTCEGDGDCGPRERCATSGAARGLCVVSDEPAPVDPCAGKLCLAPTPACHPASGLCVACTDDGACGTGQVCDRGRGQCVEPSAELCAACADDADCGPEAPTCLAVSEPFERVCVVSGCAASGCPAGFACSPARDACLPVRGSCTAYRAGVAESACSAASDCSALGVDESSVLAGVCRAGACALGCAGTPDCPGTLRCAANACVPIGADAGSAALPGDGGV